MTIEEEENLYYLFDEYRQTKEQLNELQANANLLRDELINIFHTHNIKEKKYNHKLFKLYKHISYKYPASCKAHLKIKPSKKDSLKMLDTKKDYETILDIS